MVAKKIKAADLFCGAGGTSTGLGQAAERLGRSLELVAVNHWERAVETHAKNHPSAAHFCQSLADLDPKKAVPGGKLDLLVASPECTHHSVARGGKPINDQSRASAWCVLRWCTALRVDRVLIENVPEFQTWGPIGATTNRPIKRRKGETFRAFVDALRSLGYAVDWRVLNAADFGGATTRKRLFLQAVRGRARIEWPNPTHAANPTPGLLGDRRKWRAAREVIDWSLPGESIFGRKRPLSENTLKRIAAGLKKFGGAAAEPFLVLLNGGGRQGAGGVKSLQEHAVVEPFIVPTNYGEREGQSPRCHDINKPMPTVVASGQTHGLVQPFITRVSNGGDYNCRSKDLNTPLGTITTANNFALVEPFILPHRQFDNMSVDDIDAPMRTITATNGGSNALVVAVIVPYYANGQAGSVGEPLRTVTTRDRFGVVIPDGCQLDIRFRMLQPHELAAAMGFPANYKITGNRAEQVRQIGNAVEVNQARELCHQMLEAA